MGAKLVKGDQGAPSIGKKGAGRTRDPAIVETYGELDDKGRVKFWLSQIEQRQKDEKDFEKDADDTIKVFRKGTETDGTDSNVARFNILAANVEVLAPATYSATPRPDVRRRFADPDPIGRVAAEVLERAIEFENDQFDIDHQLQAAVLDMLLPGRGTCRVMYECESHEVAPGVKLEARPKGMFLHPNGRFIGKVPGGAGYGYAPDGAKPDWEPLEGEPEPYARPLASRGPEAQNGTPAEDDADDKTDAVGDDADDTQEWYLGGTPYPHVDTERTWFEHVNWKDFLYGAGRTWEEVPWVAFRHALTRDQLRRLPISRKVADAIKLDYDIRDDNSKKPVTNDPRAAQEDMPFKRGIVWEIWFKDEKQVVFIAPSYKTAPIIERAPDVKFERFFPTPRPLIAVENPDDLTPTPEYMVYKGLAEELNRGVRRLQKIISALKARGIYAGAVVDFERVFKADDNELIPSTTAMPLIAGGAASMDALVWMVPVEKLIVVVEQLYAYVQNLKQTIYEITGISDIARGSSNPNETLGAQQLKVQFASIRIQRRQQNVQRFVRDLTRMQADVICQLFGAETLADITGIALPTAAEKKAGMEAAQLAASGQPVPPALIQSVKPPDHMPVTEYLSRPTWDDVMGILRSTIKRTHKVDIETDSTIAADAASQQKSITDLIGAIVQFFEGVAPFVQTPDNPQGMLPPDAAKTILMAAVRRFRLGAEVEEALDMIGSPGAGNGTGVGNFGPMGQPGQPNQQPAQPEPPDQVEMAKVQQQGQKDQADAQIRAREVAVKEGGLALDQQRFELDKAKAAHEMTPLADIHAGIMQQVGGLASGTTAALAQIGQTVQAVAQTVASMSAEVKQIAIELDAPAEVIRDGGGNMVGVKKGNRVRAVKRDNKGRPSGLQ